MRRLRHLTSICSRNISIVSSAEREIVTNVHEDGLPPPRNSLQRRSLRATRSQGSLPMTLSTMINVDHDMLVTSTTTATLFTLYDSYFTLTEVHRWDGRHHLNPTNIQPFRFIKVKLWLPLWFLPDHSFLNLLSTESIVATIGPPHFHFPRQLSPESIYHSNLYWMSPKV